MTPPAATDAGGGGTVRAAGGIVVRTLDEDGDPRTERGGREIVVIHRPRYDDWTFPKGKLHDGEDHVAAALREVEEETGLGCELVEELPSVRYRDAFDREKVVRYWIMRPVRDGGFAPTDEVDEVRWVRVDDAARLLSYEHDRRLLAAAGLLPETGT
jgi:8-oxo-dGTP diphosphatase